MNMQASLLDAPMSRLVSKGDQSFAFPYMRILLPVFKLLIHKIHLDKKPSQMPAIKSLLLCTPPFVIFY